ncbi:hypothetical protein [Paraburkholderia mimosarum]|uniref:hypothetical protein n=1 Tax=Paraburkholderia mimosarum TaxID=312026 RepID=UPI000483C85B|nr:hypothetical protein [Paraburkholderia mimosarum]
MAEVSRVFQGLQIEGERIAVSVQPVDEWSGDGDPTLVLGVDVRSSEWADWANMTADQVYKFTRDEIALARTDAGTGELRALHPTYPDLPGFRSGFAVEIEPGMHAQLEAALPRVERVTHLNAALGQTVESVLARSQTAYDWTRCIPTRSARSCAWPRTSCSTARRRPTRCGMPSSPPITAGRFATTATIRPMRNWAPRCATFNVLALLADAGKDRTSLHQ